MLHAVQSINIESPCCTPETNTISSVQLSRVQLFATPWPAARQASLSFINSGVYSNSCPLSRWCHPAISSSVVPSPPTFNLSQHQGLFKWISSSHQVAKVLVSASASILSMNIQDWFPWEWTDSISLHSKGLSRVFSNTTVQKHQFFSAQLSSQSNSRPYMTTGKTIALTRRTFAGRVTSLPFNKLSRLVITFLPRSKHLLI